MSLERQLVPVTLSAGVLVPTRVMIVIVLDVDDRRPVVDVHVPNIVVWLVLAATMPSSLLPGRCSSFYVVKGWWSCGVVSHLVLVLLCRHAAAIMGGILARHCLLVLVVHKLCRSGVADRAESVPAARALVGLLPLEVRRCHPLALNRLVPERGVVLLELLARLSLLVVLFDQGWHHDLAVFL